MRVEARVSALDLRIDHVAECPEDDPVRCATEPYEPYEHHQAIVWTRLDTVVAVGLGKGFQVEANLPVDLRVTRVSYTDLGGRPIDPPSDIHHRDGALGGVADGAARLWRFGSVGSWTLGAGLGSSLPVGRTVPDPFALTERGREHEHMQLGSGTFDPLVGATALVQQAHVGALLQASARTSLYENRHGYRGPSTLDATLAGLVRVAKPLQLVAGPVLVAEGPDLWSGEAHGGRVALLGELGAVVVASRAWTVQGSTRVSLVQHDLEDGEEEGTLRQPLVATLGLAYAPATGSGRPRAARAAR